MSLKKSSKRFVISNETLNSGKPGIGKFKVSTSGIRLSAFRKNPLLLWVHKRPTGERKDEVLPLGRWIDIEVVNDEITGRPAFDKSDAFAMSIYHKVENGTISMVSAGFYPPYEWEKSEEGELWLAGSDLKEASMCDIGTNPDSLPVQLYNENNDPITLSDEFIKSVLPIQKPNTDMNKIKLNLSEAHLGLLKLSAESTPDQINVAFEGLITLNEAQNQKIVTLTADKVTADAAKATAETNLTTYKTDQEKGKLVELVDKAVTEGKITADQKPDFLGDESKKIVALSFDHAKSMIDKMPANKSAEQLLSESAKNGGADAELLKLSWDEADKSGKLITLKDKYPEHFNALHKGFIESRENK